MVVLLVDMMVFLLVVLLVGKKDGKRAAWKGDLMVVQMVWTMAAK